MSESVRAVSHALDIIRLLLERGEVGVSQAAADIGVSASTAHRLLTTLTAQEFAVRTPAKRYRLGPMLAGRGRKSTEIGALVSAVRPAVRSLFERVGETVHLLVLTGSEVQFVDGAEGPQALRVGMRIGARIPAYCTSGGKAMLAALDGESVDALHSDGVAPWPGRRIGSLDELHAELTQVRLSGTAINRGESETGICAVGRAIVRADGMPVAALAVAVPAARFSSGRVAVFADALKDAVQTASGLLTT